MRIVIIVILSIIFIPGSSMAQLTLDISSANAYSDKIVFDQKILHGSYEAKVYNPINIGFQYQMGSFGLGLEFSWLEFVNNFDGIVIDPFYIDETNTSDFRVYMNGGYDRSQLASVINFSYGFLPGDIISIRMGVGVGHYFNNYLRSVTYREIFESFLGTSIDTYELEGHKGYSATGIYQAGVRVSSPKNWHISGFIEVSYQGNTPMWHASRLDFPGQQPGELPPPAFGNNIFLLKFGFSLPISNHENDNTNKEE